MENTLARCSDVLGVPTLFSGHFWRCEAADLSHTGLATYFFHLLSAFFSEAFVLGGARDYALLL